MISLLKLRRMMAVGLASVAGLSAVATAQEPPRIDITRGRSDPMPVALPTFHATSDGAKTLASDISGIITTNLDRSGLFAPMDTRAFIQRLDGVNTIPRFADWRAINATVVLSGEITELSNGRIQVAARLWDVFGSQQLGKIAFTSSPEDWRRAGHRVSDFVYSNLTGEEGYFDTYIVYVGETGPKTNRTKRLMRIDSDGANPEVLTDGLNYDALTPRFSPTREQITFMALFDDRPAQVYFYDFETGAQEALGSFRGMTFAPRFSPDGEQVLMSIEKGGNSDIAVMDLATRRMQQLTRHPAIDTSPSMSPDGQSITFASDRGGSQQIYVMDSDGDNVRRITFGDGLYATPVWSPRGDLIAFTRQYRSRFYIGVVRPDGTGERLLTESYLDEGPTWSPNGRVLMFFREERPGGPVSLWTVDLTGQNLRKIPTPTEASDPAWSPRR